MKQNIHANHLVKKDDRIDPSSEEGRKNHLDVEVTAFKVVLADFPLTDEEREELASNKTELENLAQIVIDDHDVGWATTAEIAVEIWRQDRKEVKA